VTAVQLARVLGRLVGAWVVLIGCLLAALMLSGLVGLNIGVAIRAARWVGW
jgi:hypothetical protein